MLRTPNPKRPTSMAELLDSKTIARLSRLDVSSRKIFSGKLQGERRSKRRGESVEFADHRPYTTGDDLRHIDWNILGRLDKLFMKVFLEDEDLSLHLVLDASASADCGEPSKFRFMQQAVAALAYTGLVNLNRLTLTALGEPAARDDGSEPEAASVSAGTASVLRNLRGRRRLADVERWLCGLEPRGSTDFTAACRRIALSKTGKGVLIIFSDFFFKEGYEQGLRYVAGRGFDVICVQVLSPQEIDPTITGDLRLRDVEDGDRAEITVSGPLLKRYRATLSAYNEQLRQFCGSRDMLHIAVPSDTPIETLMLDHLRRRGVLR
jgi:uncharacterized protein (DUF58 family)